MTELTPLLWVAVFSAGAVASGVNAVAGGGSLLSFPFLTAGLHMLSVPANATNSVGLWPGSLAGALGFREMFARTGKELKLLIVPTFVGSAIGSFLLLNTSSAIFDYIVPVLIVLAASLIAFGKRLQAAMKGRKVSRATGLVLQTLVSIYGGYFGAGMGIMMLAAFALYVEGSIHEQNAIKNVLGLVINFTCSTVFLIKGLVTLSVALPLVLGGLLGGYVGARLSLKVNPDKLRMGIAAYGFLAAAYFLYVALTRHG